MSTIDGLSPCTKYSIEVGAGPYIYRQHPEQASQSKIGFEDQENEDHLLDTINKIWSSQNHSFRAFASTIPVSRFQYIQYNTDFNLGLNFLFTIDLCINQMS